MLCSGTDPESYITEYTLVYQDKRIYPRRGKGGQLAIIFEVSPL